MIPFRYDTKRPTIGAAMIVRDAEHCVERAIASLKGTVQQIVVVDTGSIDNTPVIVTRAGAELHFHSWTDNFSDARNYALSLVRCDWILVLDADEQLDHESLPRDWSALDDATLGGLSVRIVNALSDNDTTSIEHTYTRLFRNNPEIRFRGAVHEQIAESIADAGLRCDQSDIRIFHDGYRNVNQQKTSRNADLLKAEIAAHPDDVWSRYHLGLTEFTAGNLQESRTILEPIMDSSLLRREQQELAHIRCAQSALAQDDLMSVERLLNFQSSDAGREGLRQYIIGAALCVKMNIADALACFVAARNSQSSLVDHTLLSTSIEQLHRFLQAQKPEQKPTQQPTQSLRF